LINVQKGCNENLFSFVTSKLPNLTEVAPSPATQTSSLPAKSNPATEYELMQQEA
jgi:hypothetical protein